jgi:peroxiredoxin
MRAKLVFAFLAGSLALSLLPACKRGSPTTPTPPSYGSKVGDTAADFSARDQNGQTVKLYQYYGKVVLINFSADWCGPCRNEAGHIERLFQDYKGQGFQILTILISGSPATWANQYQLTFPVLDDNSETLWKIYGEGYVPLNIVLDRKMIIRYKEAGYDEPAIISQIKKYL